MSITRLEVPDFDKMFHTQELGEEHFNKLQELYKWRLKGSIFGDFGFNASNDIVVGDNVLFEMNGKYYKNRDETVLENNKWVYFNGQDLYSSEEMPTYIVDKRGFYFNNDRCLARNIKNETLYLMNESIFRAENLNFDEYNLYSANNNEMPTITSLGRYICISCKVGQNSLPNTIPTGQAAYGGVAPFFADATRAYGIRPKPGGNGGTGGEGGEAVTPEIYIRDVFSSSNVIYTSDSNLLHIKSEQIQQIYASNLQKYLYIHTPANSPGYGTQGNIPPGAMNEPFIYQYSHTSSERASKYPGGDGGNGGNGGDGGYLIFPGISIKLSWGGGGCGGSMGVGSVGRCGSIAFSSSPPTFPTPNGSTGVGGTGGIGYQNGAVYVAPSVYGYGIQGPGAGYPPAGNPDDTRYVPNSTFSYFFNDWIENTYRTSMPSCSRLISAGGNAMFLVYKLWNYGNI